MALNTNEKTKILKQALEDKKTGEFTEYKGSTVMDVIFLPLDLATGDRSYSEVAREKQDYYNQVRGNNG